MDNVNISKDCLGTIESLKPPFQTTDEFVNKLINIQMKYHQKKGREFINMVFQEKFLMCSQDYLQESDVKSKKGKHIGEIRKRLKLSIQDIFQDEKDPIIPLLLLIDEGVTLLFQTDFYQRMTDYEKLVFEEPVDEKTTIENMN